MGFSDEKPDIQQMLADAERRLQEYEATALIEEAKMAAQKRRELLQSPIEPWDTGLGLRIRNALKYEGITSLAELTAHTESALLRLPNIGRKSLSEVKAFLAARGLSLSESAYD